VEQEALRGVSIAVRWPLRRTGSAPVTGGRSQAGGRVPGGIGAAGALRTARGGDTGAVGSARFELHDLVRGDLRLTEGQGEHVGGGRVSAEHLAERARNRGARVVTELTGGRDMLDELCRVEMDELAIVRAIGTASW